MEVPFDSRLKGSMTAEYPVDSTSGRRRCRASVDLVMAAAAGDGAARKRRGEVVVLYAVGPMRD